MTHDFEVHTLAAPYALHALPADEVQPFELHLEQCSSCRDEVDEIRDVAARLGAAEAVVPPAELKVRVFAEIATVRPLPPLIDASADRQPATAGPSAWRQWWPRVSVAAAAALLVVVGVLGSQLSDANRQIDEADRLSAQIQQVATAPDMRQVTERAGGSKAVVMSSRSADSAVVLPVGMDPAPDGRDYQAWFINGKEVRSAGVMDEDGGTAQPLAAGGLDDATQIGITVEPEGGSETPTADPVMLVNVPA
ncbi:MAG: anti-sigma factor [Nocardioidaceae bacterium]